MGVLRRILGSPKDRIAERREAAALETRAEAEADGESLLEIEVVGESHRQAELEQIAGGKEAFGKEVGVGVALRAEPSNSFDSNAIRVESMGQLLGYVPRDLASKLSRPIRDLCGGVLEARGLIVGGWRDGGSEGSFGIRVWITERDASRLGLTPGEVDPSLRPPSIAWPELPAAASNERRLSPTAADLAAERWGSQVTVTCEEHYQAVIVAAMPQGWDADRTWPVLVELAVADRNPHAKVAAPCVEVRIDGACVGFFTPAMAARHRAAVQQALSAGARVTATGQASRGTKGGAAIWRLKVTMAAS